MKTNELRELGADELAAKISETRKELADLKLKHKIARMLTIQSEKAAKEAK